MEGIGTCAGLEIPFSCSVHGGNFYFTCAYYSDRERERERERWKDRREIIRESKYPSVERVQLYKLPRRITRTEKHSIPVGILSVSKIYSTMRYFSKPREPTLSSLSSPRFPQESHRSNFNAMVKLEQRRGQIPIPVTNESRTKGRSHETNDSPCCSRNHYITASPHGFPSRTPWIGETVITKQFLPFSPFNVSFSFSLL